MRPGTLITERTATTNRVAPGGKCCACPRDLSETPPFKSGSKTPSEQWMRRCDCGVTNYYPSAGANLGHRRRSM